MEKEKLKNLILMIAQHPTVTELGITKLAKLIYFADARALRELGSTITHSEYIKYQHGPVPSRLEKVIKEMRRNDELDEKRVIKNENYEHHPVTAKKKPDLSCFSSEELEIIDQVIRELGPKRATTLSDQSHQEPAWIYAQSLKKLDPELIAYSTSEDPEGL